MRPDDLDAWEPQEPPPGFAERVVDAARAEGHRGAGAPGNGGRGRAVRVAVGMALVASMAAAAGMAAHLQRASATGDVVADARREVRVGSRAIAVLERGAHVKWTDDGIVQSGGDVFWRVEPGAHFTVHTAAADVTVKGTCFRVKLEGGEDDMNRRDARVGAAGAALGVAALVGVYEGKVAVSHAGQSVDLVAGQSAEADARGVRLTGAGTDPLLQANANLADSVRDYRRRLDTLALEKKKLEKQLSEAEARLGDAGPADKSEYELTPDD